MTKKNRGGCVPGQSPKEHAHKDLTKLDPSRILSQCSTKGCDQPVREPTVRKDTGNYRYYSDCKKCNNLTSRYGITLPDRNRMMKKQKSKCKICSSPVHFPAEGNYSGGSFGKHHAVIDHCHTNGHVRGILCGSCNAGLGLFYDSKESLAKAIEYLEESKRNEN